MGAVRQGGKWLGGVLGDVVGGITAPIGESIGSAVGGIINPILDNISGGDPANTSGVQRANELADEERRRLAGQISPTAGLNGNAATQQALALQQAAASGQAPSVAALQQQAGLESALAAQVAAANSARGGAGAQIAAQRNAMQQGAALQQGQINQAAQLRAAEMANARNALSSLGTSVLGMQSQNQANQNALLQNVLGMQNQAAQNAQAQANSLNETKFQSKAAALGGVLNAGGQIAAGALSDERVKANVKDGSKDIDAFLKTLSAHKYNYKDKKHGQGTFVSPMAQELEKSSVGRKMVKETPEGKMVQYDGHAMGSILASLAHLNDKIDSLSAKKGRK